MEQKYILFKSNLYLFIIRIYPSDWPDNVGGWEH